MSTTENTVPSDGPGVGVRNLPRINLRLSESLSTVRLPTLLVRSATIEFLIVACTAYFASALYYRVALLSWPPADQYVAAALFIAAMILIVSLGLRNFAAIQAQSRLRFVWSGLSAVIITFLFLLISMFVFKVAEAYSRGTFFTQLAAVAAAVLMFRTITFTRVRAAIADGRVRASRLVVIGDKAHFERVLKSLTDEGVEIARTFEFPIRRAASETAKKDRIDYDAARELVAACRCLAPDDILVIPTDAHVDETSKLAAILSELPASVHILPAAVIDFFHTAKLGILGSRTTIQIVPRPLSFFDLTLKRAFDILLAAIGLLLLSPTLVIVAAAIKLDSVGPIFFRQTRHGYNNEPIRVFKFRTMTVTEDGHSFTQATRTDPRITRIGRVLRRTNIDELPQLFNVLLGNMSIVGPRPHPVALNEQYERLLAPFMRRHNVKPGITGWAQVNGHRGETDTVDKMRRRLEYDLYYIDNWSFLFDVQIVLLTLLSRRAYANAY
jgi:Undecaprenyl-phosphate glucose phosphotransferase